MFKLPYPILLSEPGLMAISITNRYRLLEQHGVSCNPRPIWVPLSVLKLTRYDVITGVRSSTSIQIFLSLLSKMHDPSVTLGR